MNRNLAKTSSSLMNPLNSLINPWSALRDDMLDVLENFSQDFAKPFGEVQFIPKIEVKDVGSSYQVFAEIPGMSDKDINVTLKENNLILEGEKKSEYKSEEKGAYHSEFSYGKFYRAIPLSDDIDTEQISASCKNGVLEIDLKKRPEEQRKAKKIEIGKGASKSREKDESQTRQ
jgi:HSP20 family protein